MGSPCLARFIVYNTYLMHSKALFWVWCFRLACSLPVFGFLVFLLFSPVEPRPVCCLYVWPRASSRGFPRGFLALFPVRGGARHLLVCLAASSCLLSVLIPCGSFGTARFVALVIIGFGSLTCLFFHLAFVALSWSDASLMTTLSFLLATFLAPVVCGH